MPEGPEIRRAADQISRAIGGRVAQRVVFGLAPLRRHEKQLAGRRVHEVTSRGKAMLIHFEGGRTLYSHNQLYGRWEIAGAGARPQATRSLRATIDTVRASALLYSASDIQVLATGQVGRHPYIARLGVEPLDAMVRVFADEDRARQIGRVRRGGVRRRRTRQAPQARDRRPRPMTAPKPSQGRARRHPAPSRDPRWFRARG